MKQVNFNALKSIKAPEDLINRTLAAAEQAQAAAPVPAPDVKHPLPLRRRIAIAAGFLLVIGVSIFAYFQLRGVNDIPLPAAPARTGDDVTVEPSAPATEGGEPADPSSPDGTQAQRPADGATEPIGAIPTTPVGTQPAGTPATVPATVPSPLPTQEQPSAPTPVQPTDEPWVPPDDPEPSPPSECATECPTECATEWPIEAPTAAEIPGEPATPDPTEALSPGYVQGSFAPQLLTGSGKVYCTLYNDRGRNMGDSNPFAASHRARISLRSDDTVWALYEVPGSMVPEPGTYRIAFYNEDGRELCTFSKSFYR